jgi:hypothetical protein
VVSDSSSNVAAPAYISTVPPKQSIASFWALTGSNEGFSMFELNTPIGSIIDIHITAVLFNGAFGLNTGGVALTITGGTAGMIGATALDHGASAICGPVAWENYV